jgi:hypothetical protein
VRCHQRARPRLRTNVRKVDTTAHIASITQ